MAGDLHSNKLKRKEYQKVIKAQKDELVKIAWFINYVDEKHTKAKNNRNIKISVPICISGIGLIGMVTLAINWGLWRENALDKQDNLYEMDVNLAFSGSKYNTIVLDNGHTCQQIVSLMLNINGRSCEASIDADDITFFNDCFPTNVNLTLNDMCQSVFGNFETYDICSTFLHREFNDINRYFQINCQYPPLIIELGFAFTLILFLIVCLVTPIISLGCLKRGYFDLEKFNELVDSENDKKELIELYINPDEGFDEITEALKNKSKKVTDEINTKQDELDKCQKEIKLLTAESNKRRLTARSIFYQRDNNGGLAKEKNELINLSLFPNEIVQKIVLDAIPFAENIKSPQPESEPEPETIGW